MSHRFKEFASFFEVSFSGEVYLIPNENDKIKVEYIQSSKIKELESTSKGFGNLRSVDEIGVVVEMIKYV